MRFENEFEIKAKYEEIACHGLVFGKIMDFKI
jgi:hypothetical protein